MTSNNWRLPVDVLRSPKWCRLSIVWLVNNVEATFFHWGNLLEWGSARAGMTLLHTQIRLWLCREIWCHPWGILHSFALYWHCEKSFKIVCHCLLILLFLFQLIILSILLWRFLGSEMMTATEESIPRFQFVAMPAIRRYCSDVSPTWGAAVVVDSTARWGTWGLCKRRLLKRFI